MTHKIHLMPIALVTMLSAAFALSSCSRKVSKETLKSIVVLYENDVHCATNGYTKIAGLRSAVADTAYTCLVSCGDFLQGGTAGALSRGEYIVDIMRSARYDAIGLGNHEFDFGGPRLLELVPKLSAPVVSANFCDVKNGKPYYRPFIIKQCGPKKVAFVGVVTPETMIAESYSFYDEQGQLMYDLRPNYVYELVQKAVDKARKKGADYVVVLSHLGEDSGEMNIDSHQMIAATRGIDVVLDGHTHSVIPADTLLNKDGKPVIISQTGTQFANIGKLLISKDGRLSTTLIPTKECQLASNPVTITTDSVTAFIKEIEKRKVADCVAPLRINNEKGERQVRNNETNSGDLVTDAYRYVLDAEIGLSNGGGIRSERLSNEVTYGDLINMLPFENYVWKVETTGAKILELLKACTAIAPKESGDFPQISGIKFTLRLSDHAISDVMVLDKDGQYKPLDPERTYTVATINYCVESEGLHGVLRGSKVLKRTSKLYRDVVEEYLTKGLNGHIPAQYSQSQNRITIVP